MRRCASNCCQDLGEAIELTTNAQHVASADAARMQRACSAHAARAQHTCRCMFAVHALETRCVCALGIPSVCATGVRYVSADEYTTNSQRLPRVCLAWVQRDLRMYGVLLACRTYTFIRRAPRTFVLACTTIPTQSERERKHNVGPARSTNE